MVIGNGGQGKEGKNGENSIESQLEVKSVHPRHTRTKDGDPGKDIKDGRAREILREV